MSTITYPFSAYELQWLQAGYTIFGKSGPDGLRIEVMAREVGISKSSFYHHFSDLQLFQDKLMEYHLIRGRELAAKATECASFDPDFIMMILDHKEDIFFNQMLRVHRANLSYQICFETAHGYVEKAIEGILGNYLGIPGQSDLIRSIFKVTSDLFYQRMEHSNFTYEWTSGLLHEVLGFMDEVIRHSGVLRLKKENEPSS